MRHRGTINDYHGAQLYQASPCEEEESCQKRISSTSRLHMIVSASKGADELLSVPPHSFGTAMALKSSSILIVGAGTWGSSTALHLARRGYTNVTVFDAYPQPSAVSAGNDVNKIISFCKPSLYIQRASDFLMHYSFHSSLSTGRRRSRLCQQDLLCCTVQGMAGGSSFQAIFS